MVDWADTVQAMPIKFAVKIVLLNVYVIIFFLNPMTLSSSLKVTAAKLLTCTTIIAIYPTVLILSYGIYCFT